MPRVNRAIELLEQGQPIYYGGVEDRSFEGGVRAADTWADYLTFEMEHGIFDVRELSDFMRGLAAPLANLLLDGGHLRTSTL